MKFEFLLKLYQADFGGHFIAVPHANKPITLNNFEDIILDKFDCSWGSKNEVKVKIKDYLISNHKLDADEIVELPNSLIFFSEKGKINGFYGPYRFLSNFHVAPVEFEGLVFTNSESAYQSAKVLTLDEKIPFLSMAPMESRKAGQKLTLRHDWEEVKLHVMEKILVEKFKNPILQNLLVKTNGLYLEETNWWRDRFWGVSGGAGQNNLGKILMKIRDSIISGHIDE